MRDPIPEPTDLAVAISVAQKMLAAYSDTSNFSELGYAQAHGALSESLRILLRALSETTSTPTGLDLTGKRFGRLVAVEPSGKRHGKITWRCLCDCGNETTVIGSQLKSGRTKSCGCGAPQTRDLVGQQFGRLTVTEFAGRSSSKKPVRLWKCRCSCGTETTVRGRALVTGNTQSCGCLHAETVRTNGLVHGQTDTPLHRRWRGMRSRCEDPNQKGYANYGGRGIKVCARWLEPNGQGFLNFVADMGPGFSPELELDRIDVDGDYSPENCRWVTRAENQQNKRNNRALGAEPDGTSEGWTSMTDVQVPGGQRCPAAHPEDPTPCTGPPTVTVLDATNAGADGCQHHAARLLASLDRGRVYALPDAPEGAAIRVHKAADTTRPFAWVDGPRTAPSQLSHAENRRGGEGK